MFLAAQIAHEFGRYHLSPGAPVDPAMGILRARFAHGEIDAQEFAARAAWLSGAAPPTEPPSPPPSPPADA